MKGEPTLPGPLTPAHIAAPVSSLHLEFANSMDLYL